MEVIEEESEVRLVPWNTGLKLVRTSCNGLLSPNEVKLPLPEALINNPSSIDEKGAKDSFCPYTNEGVLRINMNRGITMKIIFLWWPGRQEIDKSIALIAAIPGTTLNLLIVKYGFPLLYL
jgi:hypothetical protein